MSNIFTHKPLSDIQGDNDVTKKLNNHMRKAYTDLHMLQTLKETTEEAGRMWCGGARETH